MSTGNLSRYEPGGLAVVGNEPGRGAIEPFPEEALVEFIAHGETLDKHFAEIARFGFPVGEGRDR